jgi:collagenase-like PrtC family protease
MMKSDSKPIDLIELNVATVWDDQQVLRWAGFDGVHKVTSIFGCLQEQPSGHGRAPADISQVQPHALVRHAAIARSAGIDFLYLLNGRCEHIDVEDRHIRKELSALIRWIVEEVKAAGIVVADLRLARLIRILYPPTSVRLRVSTIAGVMTPGDLLPWLPLGIDGVVLHHDVGRDFSTIARIVEFLECKADGAEVELLLNESCLYGCHARGAHYARLARAKLSYAEGFQQNCNIPRFRDPYLLLAARWIRPEDVQVYSALGVRRFKIAGREMSRQWLDRAVAAYATGSYDGNLIDLLTMTPPGLGVDANSVVFIDNRALDGFIEELRRWTAHEIGFYRSLAHRLWKQGAFFIDDPGAQYELRPSGPHCIRPGRHLGRLTELQAQSDPVFGGQLVQFKSGAGKAVGPRSREQSRRRA